MSDLGSRVFLTGVIISCTMSGYPNLPMNDESAALTVVTRNAWNDVRREETAVRNFTNNIRRMWRELEDDNVQARHEGIHPYDRDRWARQTLGQIEMAKTGLYVHKKRRAVALKNYRRLLEIKRRRAYKRLIFMHRSGRAPWRAARR